MDIKKIVNFIFLLVFSCIIKAQMTIPPFPKWEKGYLDIHHINTGRGNCAFLIFPDGTTMMIDAGDFDGKEYAAKYAPMHAAPIFPDSSYTPGSSIINYVTNLLGKDVVIDYFLLTHFHSDHYGDVQKATGTSKNGYRITGLTEVGDVIPIKMYVDRDYPDYQFPVDLRSKNDGVDLPTFLNLLEFLNYQEKHNGLKVEKFDIGSNTQFVLKKEPKSYPGFEVRNIKSNNRLWTGKVKKRLFCLPRKN